MTRTSVAVQCLSLAAASLFLGSVAQAQVQPRRIPPGSTPPAADPTPAISAYNPYTSGWGNTGGGQPRPYPASQPAAITIPDAVITASPTGAMAFNPWRRNVQPPAAITPYGTYVEPDVTSNLPSPPPGPIRSRILAVPQRGEGPAPIRTVSTIPAPSPRPVTVRTAPRPAPPPGPPPVVVAGPPPVVAAAPPPVVAATPRSVVPPAPPTSVAPPPPPPQVASAPTNVPPVAVPPPPSGAASSRVLFQGTSAELTAEARTELDRLAAAIVSRNTRQIELRAYASGTTPESRKISLARALAVRGYLIDRGVKSRIDVGAFLAEGGQGGLAERVDIVSPNG